VTTANVGDFLHHLTRDMAAELLGVESDRQLVERVLATRDESALLTIVLRHGTMVYHVCRRVLRHPQDAEDAFQATFLVLAQELRALRQHSSLAGWLHGVALRVSRKARARATAQQRRETGAARPEAVQPDDLTWSEVRSALDEELSRLPAKWRLPLVLCYLEGRTQDEAADQLGWSKSTLRRRLEQARAALGSRLKGRSIAWSTALPAVLASESLTAAAMPLARVDSTVAAALAVVNGKSAVLAASARVAVLTEGVRKTMFAKKIGIVAGALVVLTLVTAAVGGYFSAAHAAPTEVRPERAAQGPLGPDEAPALPVVSAPQLETTFARAEQPGPIVFKEHTCDVWSVCFSPDGKRIVTAGGVITLPGRPTVPGEVKVWDSEKGTEILALKGQTDRVCSVSFSPDGKRIAGACSDQTVRVWDAENGKELLSINGVTRSIGSLCFSPDSKRIASVGSRDTVKVWDAENGQELVSINGLVRPSGSVCFSPDGKRLASVRIGVRMLDAGQPKLFDAEIKVWDAEKGDELLSLKLPTSGPASVCFSPDGKRLASGGPDETIRIWNAEKGQELHTLKGHTARVNTVCFSPDGKHLASGSYDQTVRIWDAEKGKELHTLKGHTDILRSICFSPDGKRLASSSKDKTVRVWSLDKEK
jgi:RNA polymerase sigma factor (sigma-70 family)